LTAHQFSAHQPDSNSGLSKKTQKVKSAQSEELNNLVVEAIQAIKGKGIVIIDLRKLHDAPTDFFIICEGESNVQVRAITDSIYRKLKENIQTTPSHLEGGLASTWVVMDYFDTVVHVFYRETRSFYDLEDLWSDGIRTDIKDLD
jgi:ribosome-associated protein